MSTYIFSKHLVSLAIGACFFIASVDISSAQEGETEARYIWVGKTELAAHVDLITGVARRVIDTDSLDFGLGEKVFLNSEGQVINQAARFLRDVDDDLGFDFESFSRPEIGRTRTGWHLAYHQRYRELSVIGSVIGLNVSDVGRVQSLTIQAYDSINLSVSPFIGAQSISGLVRAARAINQDLRVIKSELSVLAERTQNEITFRLIWNSAVETEDKRDGWNAIIDANTGDIVSIRERVIHSDEADSPGPLFLNAYNFDFTSDQPARVVPNPSAESGSKDTYTVSGNIKLNHFTTPEVYTGGTTLERDTNIAFKYARVDLDTTTGYADVDGDYSFSGVSSGSHTLTFYIETEHAYVSTTGYNSSTFEKEVEIDVTANTVEDFDWNWGDDGDEYNDFTSMALNTLFQVETFRDHWIDDIDVSALSSKDDWKINLTSYSTPGSFTCGSTFTSGSNGFYITMQGFCAQTSEIVHHEFSHDGIYTLYGNHWIQSTWSGDDPDYDFDEAEAMDEAFPDYVTAAFSDHYAFGGPYYTSSEAAFHATYTSRPPIRLLFNSLTMDDFSTSAAPHTNGKIVSGAAWKVRTDKGDFIDDVVFEALSVDPNPQSFASFGRAMYEADETLNSKANWYAIEQRFLERKILPPLAPSSLTLTADGDDIDIAWNDLSGFEEGYDVERSTDGGAWTTISEESAGATSFTHLDVVCHQGETYKYRIRVYDDATSTEDFSPTRNWYPCNPPKIVYETPNLEFYDVPTELFEVQTKLLDAYPNPFNPVTRISFELGKETNIKLTIFDALGRVVKVMAEGPHSAGVHSVTFDASSLPSGVYFYSLTTPETQQFKSLLLMK